MKTENSYEKEQFHSFCCKEFYKSKTFPFSWLHWLSTPWIQTTVSVYQKLNTDSELGSWRRSGGSATVSDCNFYIKGSWQQNHNNNKWLHILHDSWYIPLMSTFSFNFSLHCTKWFPTYHILMKHDTASRIKKAKGLSFACI